MREAAFVRNPRHEESLLGFEWIVLRHVYPVGVRPAEAPDDRRPPWEVVSMFVVETDRGLSLLHVADLHEAVTGMGRSGPPEYVSGWVDGRPGDPEYRVTLHELEPELAGRPGEN